MDGFSLSFSIYLQYVTLQIQMLTKTLLYLYPGLSIKEDFVKVKDFVLPVGWWTVRTFKFILKIYGMVLCRMEARCLQDLFFSNKLRVLLKGLFCEIDFKRNKASTELTVLEQMDFMSFWWKVYFLIQVTFKRFLQGGGRCFPSPS